MKELAQLSAIDNKPAASYVRPEAMMADILVIDDDLHVRMMLDRLLTQAGHTVQTAIDGDEGTELYRRRPADLVITDIIMPDTQGIETIITLKEEDPDVKIFAMSGGGRKSPGSYLSQAESLGVLRTFEKPFVPEDLLSAIEIALS